MDQRNTTIDGRYDLAELQSAINFVEAAGWRLTSLGKGPTGFMVPDDPVVHPVNFASFERARDLVPDLVLVAVSTPQTIGNVIATQLVGGKHLVTYSELFVRSASQHVASFR